MISHWKECLEFIWPAWWAAADNDTRTFVHVQLGHSCQHLRVKGRLKGGNRVDCDKLICSMSQCVAGPGWEEHTILRSKEKSVSQWPWGSLVLSQNFWLDVMQSLSGATSAGKMLEWWSKMCWHIHWQHAHGQIFHFEQLRNHFSRPYCLSCVSVIHKTLLLSWTPWVILSSVCSTVYHQRVDSKEYCRVPQLFP